MTEIQCIVDRLKDRSLKQPKNNSIVGLLLIAVAGLYLMYLCAPVVASTSNELWFLNMHRGFSAQADGGGPLAFIFIIISRIGWMLRYVLMVFFPILYGLFMMTFVGLLIAILTYLFNYINTTLLKIIYIAHGILGGIYYDILLYPNLKNESWVYYILMFVMPVVFTIIYFGFAQLGFLGKSCCNVCGRKFSKIMKIPVSSDCELKLLNLLDTQDNDLIADLELTNPSDAKNYIDCTLKYCKKEHQGDSLFWLSKVKKEEPVDNNSSSATRSSFWFCTVVSYELKKEMVSTFQ